MTERVTLVECPRDAMQGIKPFIPTTRKIDYLNSLLRVGYDTLDFGSFVSAKAIPQLVDTEAVLAGLELNRTNTKLLAIVANVIGAERALSHPQIKYLGFPFSISETFQQRNTNKSQTQAYETIVEIMNLCRGTQTELVVYLSMGFGNPYGEPWSVGMVEEWSEKMAKLGVKTVSLSDTIGTSNRDNITQLFGKLIPTYPDITFGAHLHTAPHNWREKIEAAWDMGCRRFDSAIKGFGGCPMAKDDLVGNMPTENLLTFLAHVKADTGINMLSFESAYNEALRTFPLEH